LLLLVSSPLLQVDEKATRLLIILIAALHAGLAISFIKVLFFSRYIIAPLSETRRPQP
jgi:hypothetical protein